MCAHPMGLYHYSTLTAIKTVNIVLFLYFIFGPTRLILVVLIISFFALLPLQSARHIINASPTNMQACRTPYKYQLSQHLKIHPQNISIYFRL